MQLQKITMCMNLFSTYRFISYWYKFCYQSTEFVGNFLISTNYHVLKNYFTCHTLLWGTRYLLVWSVLYQFCLVVLCMFPEKLNDINWVFIWTCASREYQYFLYNNCQFSACSLRIMHIHMMKWDLYTVTVVLNLYLNLKYAYMFCLISQIFSNKGTC